MGVITSKAEKGLLAQVPVPLIDRVCMAYIRACSRRHPTIKLTFWCQNCEIWVALSDMLGNRTDDDDVTDKSCRGCDTVLASSTFDYDNDV